MSFLPCPPKKIFFCCLEAPTSQGGETTLCDFKKVYDQMDPSVRDKFESKGVAYIRNYSSVKPFLSQPLQLKGWSAVFETEKKEEVEKELRRTNMDFKWGANDHLCITNKASAVEVHPVTGDKIWFNHLSIFHWAMPYQEYGYIFKRMRKIFYLFLTIISWIIQNIFVAIKKPAGMGMHTMFGDGSEIPLSDVSHVREIIHKNMVFDRWRKGDLLMIDNFRVSHGRQPYSGKRKIVVAWSHPLLKPSLK
ncbi:PREDICTED: uncharacterized protein LOC105315478 [Amphimedon queenslandica]|uniref:TauD/TfdA-like domain-containing protein n=1 Tax=Amphimedon queenslandica TaxID=400682 RepID=A0A1X7T110_AMPQE|nr:PREDICTED: uncharacterized protein LOC105315478 [Amphimedon queenslandica]|eukprot:XP_019861907.1 PREDICTED: uncharacterized protein LOC105315478 [Amphimedon queenslandica]